MVLALGLLSVMGDCDRRCSFLADNGSCWEGNSAEQVALLKAILDQSLSSYFGSSWSNNAKFASCSQSPLSSEARNSSWLPPEVSIFSYADQEHDEFMMS